MKRFALLLLSWVPCFSWGQIVMDGNSNDAAWRILGLVNTTGTANSSFGASNTLGALKFHSNSNTLFIAITGNIDANNHIVLFVDNLSYSGRGPNKLGANMTGITSTVFRSSSGSCPDPKPNGLSGSIMDNGFDADFAFAFNKGSTANTIYLDAVRFSNYLNDPVPTPAYLAGPHFVGTCNQSGATSSHAINITNWNTGTDQISFAWQNGYDPVTEPHRGLEISIPYTAMPGTSVGDQAQFFAIITNAEGFASNVCIPGDPGPSSLGCSFNLSTISNPGEDIFYTTPLVALPLSFLGISAKWVGEGVRLDWSVAEQGESNHYEIERSPDGVRFEKIGILSATDQGSIARYHFVDAALPSSRGYYRIVAVKRNGAMVNSKTVRVDNKGISLMSIFPNPTASKVFVRMGDWQGKSCDWTLYNELGQRMLSGRLPHAQALECLSFPPSLPSGHYRLTMASGEAIASRSLQILR
jgi:hypothetical protein